LWIAGRFGYLHEQREFESRLEADADLRSRVTWLGIVPYDQVPGLLSGADIGLVPLQPVPKFEKNIPTKQFEYMAAGLPIVASDLAPIRQFVASSQAGRLAVPDDARSHADEIAYLVKHPGAAKRMGENGQAAFEAKYNWDSEAKKLVDLYHGLVP
jgi:glycosyltransferase involved in cell wall biosynthesis